ncbi:hypothetical protein HU761_03075 [Pseudomonas sp. SWRI59]|uniref:hypothetical protein n=1 Tax=unclassified Pseudomonas TaxID=196821 RepID=UPI001645716F|nr:MULTISPECIES: hypothetical protein [unclassified Pseudomonas]MBC3500387.1 hypothetical protein [Pseudomonas sp. SWRI59]MBC3507921.1 hypothetical protein [Pseudomonas sp. SWRI68]
MNTPANSSSKRQIAEQDRRAYRLARTAYLSRLLTELPPVVPGIIDHTDGTLSREAASADLLIQIPAWKFLPEEDDTETVQLQISTVGLEPSTFRDIGESKEVVGPADPSDFPLEMFVPLNQLAEGRLWLRYKIVTFNSSTVFSSIVPLICDRTAPYNPTLPDGQLDALSLPIAVIDDDYLADHPNGLTASIPTYHTAREGDTYQVFYFDHFPSEHDDYSTPVHRGPVDVAAPQVLIPRAVIEEAKDGKYYLAYYLTDKAHNKSRISLATPLNVTLGALPKNLQLPEVPLAQADNLIDLKDAIQGVTVLIQTYDNARETDHIAITWGTAPLVIEPVGAKPFPIYINVPNPILHDQYTATDVPQATAVKYAILRGEVPFPSQPISVDVDFSIVGPVRPDPDPTWPDPINPLLPPPSVIGGGSGGLNKLDHSDANIDATLLFELYDNAQDGEVVDFYWEGILVTEARYTVDTSDGPTVERILPWEYILEASNNSELKLYYTIRKTDDALNEQQSKVQLVNANAVIITLPLPVYQGVVKNWINCDSLANSGAELSLKVAIPDLRSHFTLGEKITLYWEPWWGASETDGSDPVIDAQWNETITLDVDHIGGFIWEVKPYKDYLLPTFNPPDQIRARARVRYNKEDDPGLSSEWAVQRMSIAEGGSSCSIP